MCLVEAPAIHKALISASGNLEESIVQKGLGIAALVMAVIAVFIPIAGPWLTIVAAALAAFAYGAGLAMAIASIVLNFVNLIFMSPSFWVGTGVTGKGVPIFLLGASVAAIIILIMSHNKHKAPSA